MGGLLSRRLIFSSALSPNHSVARMCPTTCTSDEFPVRTSMDPDPVSTCRFTLPLTLRVRSNSPCVAARAGRQMIMKKAEMSSANRMEVDFKAMVPPVIAQTLLRLGDWRRSPSLQELGLLLQDDLIVLLQTIQDFSLSAV